MSVPDHKIIIDPSRQGCAALEEEQGGDIQKFQIQRLSISAKAKKKLRTLVYRPA